MRIASGKPLDDGRGGDEDIALTSFSASDTANDGSSSGTNGSSSLASADDTTVG